MLATPATLGQGRLLPNLRTRLAKGALLLLLVVITYLPSLRGGFVWDDDTNIETATVLRSLRGLGQIWVLPGATQQYYPLTHTSFWLDYHLFGLQPLGYHIENVLLHAFAAWLAFRILEELEVPGALFGALLFAVHPLQAESVAWITERKNCLSGVFAAVACLAYLRYAGLGPAGRALLPAQRSRAYGAAVLLFALGLGAKTAIVGLPIVFAALIAWKLRGEGLRAHALRLAPFIALSFAASVMTTFIEARHVNSAGDDFVWSSAQRLLIASRALGFYTSRFVAPWGLMFVYPRWDIDPSHGLALVPLAVAIAVGAALFLLRKRLPGGLFAAVVSYGALVGPALGLVNLYYLRYAFVQNHFQYFAALPAAALVGAGLCSLSRRAFPLLAACIVVVFAALSARECLAFQSRETLFGRAVLDNPGAWMPRYNLALELQRQGRNTEAAAHYTKTLELRPGYLDATNNLAAALFESGRYDAALARFDEVARGRPTSADAALNLAIAYDRLGRSREAVQQFRRTLSLDPKRVRAQRMLAWVLATDPDSSLRNGAEAVALATSACAHTRNAVSRCLDTLAAAHAEAGQFDEAIAAASRAEREAQAAGDPSAARRAAEHRSLYERRAPLRRGAQRAQDE